MKVILLEDVYKKGVAGDVVEVANGYAHNYLIPKKLAVKATPGAMRSFENLSKTAATRRAARENKFEKIAEQIRALTLYFPVKASEAGKLYGSVTSTEISDALKAEIGLDIDRRRIGDRPLRELGSFPVVVRLDTGLSPDLTVIVYREGDDPRAVEVVEEFEVEAAAEVEVVEAPEAEAAEVETTEETTEEV